MSYEAAAKDWSQVEPAIFGMLLEWALDKKVKMLEPACGMGNFLYVTLDLLKGLEQ